MDAPFFEVLFPEDVMDAETALQIVLIKFIVRNNILVLTTGSKYFCLNIK